MALKRHTGRGRGKGQYEKQVGKLKEKQKMGWTGGSSMRDAAQWLVADRRPRCKDSLGRGL